MPKIPRLTEVFKIREGIFDMFGSKNKIAGSCPNCGQGLTQAQMTPGEGSCPGCGLNMIQAQKKAGIAGKQTNAVVTQNKQRDAMAAQHKSNSDLAAGHARTPGWEFMNHAAERERLNNPVKVAPIPPKERTGRFRDGEWRED